MGPLCARFCIADLSAMAERHLRLRGLHPKEALMFHDVSQLCQWEAIRLFIQSSLPTSSSVSIKVFQTLSCLLLSDLLS